MITHYLVVTSSFTTNIVSLKIVFQKLLTNKP